MLKKHFKKCFMWKNFWVVNLPWNDPYTDGVSDYNSVDETAICQVDDQKLNQYELVMVSHLVSKYTHTYAHIDRIYTRTFPGQSSGESRKIYTYINVVFSILRRPYLGVTRSWRQGRPVWVLFHRAIFHPPGLQRK